VIEAMHDEQFAAGTPFTKDELARRPAAYEALAEDLGRAAALITYWSRTTDQRIVPDVLARLAKRDGAGGRRGAVARQAPLSSSAGDVCGRARCSHRSARGELAGLLASAQIRERGEWKPNVFLLNTHGRDRPADRERSARSRAAEDAKERSLGRRASPWLEDLEPIESRSSERSTASSTSPALSCSTSAVRVLAEAGRRSAV
jgi:hypothetical protein